MTKLGKIFFVFIKILVIISVFVFFVTLLLVHFCEHEPFIMGYFLSIASRLSTLLSLVIHGIGFGLDSGYIL